METNENKTVLTEEDKEIIRKHYRTYEEMFAAGKFYDGYLGIPSLEDDLAEARGYLEDGDFDETGISSEAGYRFEIELAEGILRKYNLVTDFEKFYRKYGFKD